MLNNEFAFVLFYKIKTNLSEGITYLLKEMKDEETFMNLAVILADQIKSDKEIAKIIMQNCPKEAKELMTKVLSV